ncbi:MAG: hypothetical protein FJX56_03985 [Alphaproteobacteria bacterium]|nr:hypothetical protein [Alphaproteobacteria bacterium]
MRILYLLIPILGLGLASPAVGGEAGRDAILYKDPQCGCCEAYAEYLRENGYSVRVVPTHDLSLIKQEHGVPAEFEGCHTTLIDLYVIEGHVPVATLDRLLSERPFIKGISLSGMPEGSPGMSGRKTEPFTIYELSEGTPRVYAVE